jgi:hypothetical protein
MKARALFAALLACAGLVACSVPSGTTSGQRTHAVENDRREAAVRQEIRHCVARKEFLPALTLIRQETARGTPESRFAKESEAALQGAVEVGRALLEKGRYGEAGAQFRQVLDRYPRKAPGASNCTKEQITQCLNLCADKLMEKGLAEYRTGQLQAAVRSWSAILAFDPGRKEAERAVETTTIQLRNLQSKR